MFKQAENITITVKEHNTHNGDSFDVKCGGHAFTVTRDEIGASDYVPLRPEDREAYAHWGAMYYVVRKFFCSWFDSELINTDTHMPLTVWTFRITPFIDVDDCE